MNIITMCSLEKLILKNAAKTLSRRMTCNKCMLKDDLINVWVLIYPYRAFTPVNCLYH